MRRYLISLLASAVAFPAHADQSGTWTGFYLGVGGGGGATVNRVSSTVGGTSASADSGTGGVLGTVFAGYDYQFGQVALIGLMGDLTFSTMESRANATAGGISAYTTAKNDFGWSILARAGLLASPSALLYIAGGYTGMNVRTTGTAIGGAGGYTQRDDVVHGWAIGPGIETKLGNGWSARLEYRYSQYETKGLPGGINIQPSTHTTRVGFAYKFGTGDGAVMDEDQPNAPESWSSFYLGLMGGAGVATNRIAANAGTTVAATETGGPGILGGVFGGGDWQVGKQMLVGIMGDYVWSGLTANSQLSFNGGGSAGVTTRVPQGWSILGRVGWLPTPSTLLYGLAGYSGETIQTSANVNVGGSNANFYTEEAVHGWTVGPGLEAAFTGNWSSRLEYRYTRYDDKSYMGGSVIVQPSSHTVRAGIAYKFPVVSK